MGEGIVNICQLVVAPLYVECCNGKNSLLDLRREKQNEKITDVFDENSVVGEGSEALCSPGDFVCLLVESDNLTDCGSCRGA